MPALPLDEEETDAVLLGLCLVARWGAPMVALAAERAIGRVEAAVPTPAPPAAPPSGGPPTGAPGEAARRIDRAIAAGSRLRLLYRDGDRQWSRRVVWPVEIAGGADADLLVAWCETRAAFRHFRLDRIEHAEPLALAIPTPRRVLVARYRAESIDRAG